MLIHNIIYNWVDLSDTNATTNNLVVQEVDKAVGLRCEIIPKQNSHWTTTTNTLASWRLFTFKWTIFGDRAGSMNGQTVLNGMLTLDWEHELSFDDDWWNSFKCQAKVFKMPEYKTTLENDIVEFTFELYSEDPTLISFTDKSALWWYWTIWGTVLWTTLGTTLSNAIWVISINHLWNFRALTKITLVWSIDNPKVFNYANSEFYKLNRTTSNLIIDNTVSPTVITDSWINVKADRAVWSTWIVLEPWINNLLVLWDDYSPTSPLVVTIYYNDSYINS